MSVTSASHRILLVDDPAISGTCVSWLQMTTRPISKSRASTCTVGALTVKLSTPLTRLWKHSSPHVTTSVLTVWPFSTRKCRTWTAASFDRDEFLERCYGDCDIALELLRMFEDRATSQRDTIDVAIAQGDRERLVSVAHALKGVAGHLSAKTLMTVTSRIDREYRHTSDTVDSMLGDVLLMRREIERCLSELPRLRESMASGRSLNPGR